MVLPIYGNASAIASLFQVRNAQLERADSLERLSTGLEVRNAKDAPQRYLLGQGQRADLKAWTRITQGLNNARGVLDVALKGGTQVSDLLGDIKAKITQGVDQGLTPEMRAILQQDLDQLVDQIDRFVDDSEYNGINLLKGVEGVTPPGGTGAGTIDFVFVVDVSGSMGPYIERVADAITALAQNYESQGITVNYGLVRYAQGFVPEIDDVLFAGNQFTTDPADLEAALRALPATGGGAAGIDALEFARTNYAWAGQRNLMLVTDTTINEVGTNDPTALIANLQADGVTTHVVGSTAFATHFAGYDRLADGTGGSVMNIQSESYDVLLDAISSNAATAAGATGDFMPVFVNTELDQLFIGHQPMSTDVLSLSGLNLEADPHAAIAAIDSAIESVQQKLTRLGGLVRRVDDQVEQANVRSDAVEESLSHLVDVDLAREQARLVSADTRRELTVQSLNIANQSPRQILSLIAAGPSLFRGGFDPRRLTGLF